MKKSYIAPQTEAIKLLGENAIMVGSPTGGPFIPTTDATVNGEGGF